MRPVSETADRELKHDGADLVAELWRAVETVAARPPAARDAVRSVLRSLIDEEGADSPFAPSLHAALAAIEPAGAPRAAAARPVPARRAGRTGGWKRIAAIAWTSGA